MKIIARINCDKIGVIRIQNNVGLDELLHDKNACSIFVGSHVKLVRRNKPTFYGRVNKTHSESSCLNIDIIDALGNRERYISSYTRKKDSNGFMRLCALDESLRNGDEYLEQMGY